MIPIRNPTKGKYTMDLARSLSRAWCFLLTRIIVRNCSAVMKFRIIVPPRPSFPGDCLPRHFLAFAVFFRHARVGKGGHFREDLYPCFNEGHPQRGAGALAEPQVQVEE